MANLCIIPARGGSKRIPGKNVKSFLGKPIIAYSIEAALESELFDEIMVSTDDILIADIAKKYGAKIPFFRSNKNADDHATTFDVIQEVITEYENKDQKFQNICCIYPCAPFVTSEHLKESHRLLTDQKYDTVFPIIPFSFPIQRAMKLDGNKLNFYNPEFEVTRSQDLEVTYHDAGQYYWMNVAAVIEKRKIVTSNSGATVISEMEAQDIDNEIDWKMAELKYKLLQK